MNIAIISSFEPLFHPTPVYQDKGSGATLDATFWRPAPHPGFFILGDYCVGNYDNPPAGNVVVVSSDNDTDLAAPVGFEQIWSDAGSGADWDGSLWKPIPPSDDYLALGHIAQRGNSTNDIPVVPYLRCVHKSLVVVGKASDKPVWSDKGSGAREDVSVWESKGSRHDTGTFYAEPGYDHPDKSKLEIYILTDLDNL